MYSNVSFVYINIGMMCFITVQSNNLVCILEKQNKNLSYTSQELT